MKLPDILPDVARKVGSVEFMRALEEEYRQVSGLKNRSEYKIFYGQVFPAPILTLGLNPAGIPEQTTEDGTRHTDGAPASSSASYFEQMKNDILDCDWRENTGLRKLLLPLVSHDHERFRREIVKTNISFRRSPRKKSDFAVAEREAAPFIETIIARVSPRLIVLTGPSVERFLELHALDHGRPLIETIKDTGIKHVVFAATAARLRSSVDRETIIVQVAHASQFGWTDERYGVSAKIAGLINTAIDRRPER